MARAGHPDRGDLVRGLLVCLFLGGLAGAGGAGRPDAWGDPRDAAGLAAARASITPEECGAHVALLAAPEREGRDSPSRGLEAAAAYLEGRLAAAGLEGAGSDGSFRFPFTRGLPAPDPARCRLAIDPDEPVGGGEAPAAPALGVDFVPLPGCVGEASGPAVFAGYGISRRREHYDDLARLRLRGKVAVILAGEPRTERLFEGPDVLTDAADDYDKVAALVDAGAAGVLIVRRPPAAATVGPDGRPLAPPALGYRYTWAQWNPATTEPLPLRRHAVRRPVVEVTPELAARALGSDPLALAEAIDVSGRPVRWKGEGRTVTLATGFESRAVDIDDVVAWIPGVDPALRDQVLVLGAHYDHIGVDPWGRIGLGADDNASGTAALLEVADALAAHPPRRSVLVCFFAAEEDGMLGSRALVDSPPVPVGRMVAMLNMDMVGRGDPGEVVVLGTRRNPDLGDALEEALDLGGTGIQHVVTDRAQHLWERSDHISFHRAGVPVLFFFEAVSESQNRDYHTFRDAPALVDEVKVGNTARLVLQTAWLLANADARPAPPRER